MRYLIISFVLLLNTHVFSQFTTMFNDTLRPFGNGAYTIDNVIEDSGFYYTSGVFNSSIGQFPYILKMSNSGLLLNKKLFIDTIYGYALYPYNSMIHKKNKLVFCSQYKNTKGTVGFVASINKHTLDTIWTKTYAHPDTAIAYQPNSGQFLDLTAIKSTSDGGYILTGNYNKNCITGNIRSFLMKIDSVGNVEWRRTYNDVGYVFSLELAPNGGFSFINKYGGTNFILTDSLGNILWRTAANNLIGRATSGDLKYVGNNCFVVSTPFMYNNDISNPLFGVNIFKINILNKQILWDKTFILYNNFDCISLHQAMGVETLPNGDIIVSGTADRYGHDAVILKLNSNGDSLWCKSYDFNPDPYDCQLNDLIITDDGGFMGVGFWSDQSGPGWTAWMFKTDANGVIGWESHKPNGESEKFKVRPNPAREFVIIEYDSPTKAVLDLTIYNSVGKMVKSYRLSENQAQNRINISDMRSGIYFCKITKNGEILGVQKLIILE